MPIKKLCGRAAKMWGISEEAVVWEKGYAKPAGPNAGEFPAIVAQGDRRGRRQHRRADRRPQRVQSPTAPGSASPRISCDVEVDRETGATKILRYTVIQDAGKAIHPSYVEGQYQGGAAQGIGWALNEEYVYGKDGRLQNAGFLDYRIPVCSDLPMIDTVILEIPNPKHPYGVRGVGETSIVPPLAAIANAVSNAVGRADDPHPDVAAAHSQGAGGPLVIGSRPQGERVRVTLWGSLRSAAEGRDTVEIEAATIRELFSRLGKSYPGLKPFIDRGIAVSINGQIFRNSWSQSIPKGAEVYLLPRIAGG